MLYAQKLSPNAEAYLLRPELHRSFMPSGVAGTTEPERVNAIVEMNDPAAIGSLEALGVDVYVQVGSRVTASIPVGALREVAALEEVAYVQMASSVTPCMDQVRRSAGVENAHSSLAAQNALGRAYMGKDVVVGIVDNGFEYGHLDFYSPDGKELRVKRVWDQNTQYGRTPASFDYGTEYLTETEILNARYDVTSATHGSHVAGIAAGGDRSADYYGVAPEADIVLVSYKSDNVDIINGVKYIFEYAESVGKPCVVNLSIGTQYGPHDGSSYTDQMLDDMCGPGRVIVGAAGNDGSVKLHARKVFTESDTQLKTMIGYPSTSSMIALLDIWGSVGSNFRVKGVVVDNLKGQIVASTEEVSSDETGSHHFTFYAEDVGASCYFTIVAQANKGNNRPNVYVEHQATSLSANRRLGIIVTGENGEEVNVWNCTGGELINAGKAGWTAGDTDYTVSEIGGTARRVVSVGAYSTRYMFTNLNGDSYAIDAMSELEDIAFFSSRGPTLDGRRKPDLAAPGGLTISAYSQYAEGTSSDRVAKVTDAAGNTYYYGWSGGTSMAAPVVTGVVALWLEACPWLSPEDVLEIVESTAVRDEFTGEVPTDGALDCVWGAGKMDAYAGLLAANRLTTGIAAAETGAGDARVEIDRRSRRLRLFVPGSCEGIDVEIFSASGACVAGCRLAESSESVSVAGLPAGVYVVRYKIGNRQGSVKVVI